MSIIIWVLTPEEGVDKFLRNVVTIHKATRSDKTDGHYRYNDRIGYEEWTVSFATEVQRLGGTISAFLTWASIMRHVPATLLMIHIKYGTGQWTDVFMWLMTKQMSSIPKADTNYYVILSTTVTNLSRPLRTGNPPKVLGMKQNSKSTPVIK